MTKLEAHMTIFPMLKAYFGLPFVKKQEKIVSLIVLFYQKIST